jgi:hypothetical protein
MKKTIILISVVLSIIISISCKKEKKQTLASVDCTTITFSSTIMPIINSNCSGSGCHGSGSSNGEFTSHSTIKPYADNGKLKSRVIDIQDMPKGGSLTADQLAQINCWLNAGAPNN